MLSPSARPYIDASVPVLREHGVAITRRFYAQMFSAHPELRSVFNLGNQASGAQQNALASAVLAYAANIDRPDVLAPVIDRIAHKHASLGITPSQYPIVGRHLLGAIKDVLGAAASPELLSAWDEAYWLLAAELIAAEARLYDRAKVRPGELRELTVTRAVRENEEVVSYYLERPGGGSPGGFAPGQYVSVAVDLPSEGLRQLRQYSLSSAPSRPYWRITVKREQGQWSAPAGLVSNLLHGTLKAGDTLRVSAAFGEFVPSLSEVRPIALLSAGVGITPLIATLHALADGQSQRPVLFAHAARDREHHLFADEVRAAGERLPNLTSLSFYESGATLNARGGTMALSNADLTNFREASFYLCGPLGFLRAAWRDLVELGISPTQLQREVFGPELLDHLG